MPGAGARVRCHEEAPGPVFWEGGGSSIPGPATSRAQTRRAEPRAEGASIFIVAVGRQEPAKTSAGPGDPEITGYLRAGPADEGRLRAYAQEPRRGRRSAEGRRASGKRRRREAASWAGPPREEDREKAEECGRRTEGKVKKAEEKDEEAKQEKDERTKRREGRRRREDEWSGL